MRDYMERYAAPGASLAYTRGEHLLYAAAYGVACKSPKADVTEASLFRIASNSKAFTSTAIFTLIESGRLSLTDRVFGTKGILNQFSTNVSHQEWLGSITIQHLLTHTAGGWRNDWNDPMYQKPEYGQQELIAFTLRSLPLQYPPGAQYAYSNFGYCLLGRVIEKITGTSYAQYTLEHVINRAGIDDMRIANKEPAIGEVHYYPKPSDGNAYNFPIARMDSHGGWIATAIDQARFLGRLFAPSDTPGARGLIGREYLKLMTTPSRINPRYACGLFANNDGACWHDGSLPGTWSFMMHTRTGVSSAAVINASDLGSNLDDLTQKMARAMPDWHV
jgi:CubicO group peptidase (beta-lactamase class C family)